MVLAAEWENQPCEKDCVSNDRTFHRAALLYWIRLNIGKSKGGGDSSLWTKSIEIRTCKNRKGCSTRDKVPKAGLEVLPMDF